MTPEPPTHNARRNRPDPTFRRRALGLAEGATPPLASPARESFRSALSRIPDLDRSAPEEPVAGKVVPPSEGPEAEASRAVAEREPSPGEIPEGAPSPARARTTPAPRSVPWWRRVSFAVVLTALVVSIPVLGRTGYRVITDSTDGRTADGTADPGEPGYEELVTPSPTALLIQKDATTGAPVNLTFLALAGDGGGTVIFVPLDTALARPGFGFDRLRTAYSKVVEADIPAAQADLVLGQQTGAILNSGVGQVIVLDDAGWDRTVGPVAPLNLDNPDPVVVDGEPVGTGPVQVAATDVGPYLRAARDGEADANRFFRQEQLWRSWLAAVAGSDRADVVPGESTAGIGLFARRLAGGPVNYATLPGTLETGPSPLYVPDADALAALVAAAVPVPTAGYPGSRVPVRLLNGVAAADIPTEITKTVVAYKGSVDVVGNGPAFGTAKTDLVYGDPAQKAFAEILRAGLGATGEVRQDPAAPDNIGVTVILGRDLLGDQTATTTTAGPLDPPPSTTTPALGGP